MEINNNKVSFSKGINFRLSLVPYQYVHYDKDGYWYYVSMWDITKMAKTSLKKMKSWNKYDNRIYKTNVIFQKLKLSNV